jgi:hypothetical protein
MTDTTAGAAAPFKLLRGHRVLLKRPVKKESAIQLDAATEAEMEMEMMRKWTNLEVFAVGNEVKEIAAGDKVYITPDAIQNAGVIHVNGEVYLRVSEYDIEVVW